MNETSEDRLIVAVWVSMADHFLDTETRHDLPLTALCCVQAGLSTARARDVWQREVSPAVGFNLLSVAGEWAGWDHDWLIERIQRARARGWHRAWPWRKLRWPMPLMGGQWLAIERCIEYLQALPAEEVRLRAAGDLARLAKQAFDFCAEDWGSLEAEERRRLCQLYPATFTYLLGPALACSERKDADRRVQLALSVAPR